MARGGIPHSCLVASLSRTSSEMSDEDLAPLRLGGAGVPSGASSASLRGALAAGSSGGSEPESASTTSWGAPPPPTYLPRSWGGLEGGGTPRTWRRLSG
eukprot:1844038-Pyramimonas_sp.AAC.1